MARTVPTIAEQFLDYNIVLEQAWDAPRGTGEIVVIDNRTVQHAAYYRTPAGPGYPIGARYLY